jgi:predicted N-acetyltransferase YhbS
MRIVRERPRHAAAVSRLVSDAFGPERFRKTVYRFRDGVPPIASLGRVAVEDGRVMGTLRFWPVALADGRPSLLLGPLAICPALRGQGLGGAMMRTGIEAARADGHASIILVGDPEYYERFGFTRDRARHLALPGPVEERRFLALDLVPGALDGADGLIRAVPETPLRIAA